RRRQTENASLERRCGSSCRNKKWTKLSHWKMGCPKVGQKKQKAQRKQSPCKGMVPRRGLEPPRLAAHGPEPCASTNSATWASDRMTEKEAWCFAVHAWCAVDVCGSTCRVNPILRRICARLCM